MLTKYFKFISISGVHTSFLLFAPHPCFFYFFSTRHSPNQSIFFHPLNQFLYASYRIPFQQFCYSSIFHYPNHISPSFPPTSLSYLALNIHDCDSFSIVSTCMLSCIPFFTSAVLPPFFYKPGNLPMISDPFTKLVFQSCFNHTTMW